MKTSTVTARADLYTRVTERVIADLEHGVRPWLKPWNAGHAAGRITLPLRHNGTPYRGINILLLWGEAMTNGYASPLWMTFKQALALEAHVRKGEHGAMVVYADRITRKETDADGHDVERERIGVCGDGFAGELHGLSYGRHGLYHAAAGHRYVASGQRSRDRELHRIVCCDVWSKLQHQLAGGAGDV